jgi:hypothetical protein
LHTGTCRTQVGGAPACAIHAGYPLSCSVTCCSSRHAAVIRDVPVGFPSLMRAAAHGRCDSRLCANDANNLFCCW